MKQQNKLKILNDPIYGFISIPSREIFQLIEHPYFQRLRRITQMGLSYLVYPGAHHTRFHHALGCMHLMQKAVQVLRSKGVVIDDKEEDALYKTILLHDIGHGPFSHALEYKIVKGVTHEQLSLNFMQALNEEFNGSLTLAIKIFKGEYHRPFMLQLISSQLDMDRLDYLKRDSFYTGVAEGNINSTRLIAMLNVVNDELVVEEKGIYSIEHFLTSRRLMYWQVYLHKTGIAAEHLLQSFFKRLVELYESKVAVSLPDRIEYFITRENFDQASAQDLKMFARLDDTDVFTALKMNVDHEDFVLRELSNMLLNRQLLKVKFRDAPVSEKKLNSKIIQLQKQYKLSEDQASYFVFQGVVKHTAFAKANPIKILTKTGKVKELLKVTKEDSFKALTKVAQKHYYCHPKLKDNS